ncbi:MAG: MoaE-MoaD fusion protein, partial [Thermoleophilaceae bacterium]|nr:MoaE-MoaD fusion protein [Thermoleophilaceae bacterium]
MEVTIKLFAMLRERAGAREVTIELPAGARVGDAISALGDVTAGMPLVMAVNREYARDDHVLDAGDELALIPPVSGGEAAVVHARVTAEPLSL